MLKAEEQMELAVLKKHGASIRGLSRSTGRSRNTVRRYLRGGDAVAKRKPAPKRAEKLDPFKAYIVDRMKAALPDRIPATVLFREIKERGYEGGETRVKLFVRGLTPLPAAAPAVRFETTPGHQMQADWATVGRGADKLSLFIATLGWCWAFASDATNAVAGTRLAASPTRKSTLRREITCDRICSLIRNPL